MQNGRRGLCREMATTGGEERKLFGSDKVGCCENLRGTFSMKFSSGVLHRKKIFFTASDRTLNHTWNSIRPTNILSLQMLKQRPFWPSCPLVKTMKATLFWHVICKFLVSPLAIEIQIIDWRFVLNESSIDRSKFLRIK